jgi:predicted nucleic acid-binding protein
MARYFLDSSALVKRYHREHGSDAVEQLFMDANHRCFISRLALVELHSCFARLVREKVISETDFAHLILRLDGDVSDGILNVVALSSQRLEGAARILRTYGLENSVRTLDAIHLATAEALNERTTLAAFVAADRKLLAVAANACGLTVIDVG